MRRVAMLVAVGLVVVGAAMSPATPVSAHGGNAEIEVVLISSEGRRARIDVALRFLTDGDPADPNQFDAVAVGTTGDAAGLGPVEGSVEFSGEPGRYTAVFDLPSDGGWLVSMETTFPPGSLDQFVEVVEGTSSSSTTSPSAAPTGPSSVVEPRLVDDGSDDGTPVVLWVGLALAVVAAVVVGVRLSRR